MTDHLDPQSDVDDRARRAASGLHQHVRAHVDSVAPLAALSEVPRPTGRGRVMAVAAALLLIAGSLALLSGGGDGGRSRLDLDELPAPVAGELRPLGPRDGRDSVQLPLTAEPSTDLDDGDTVAVSTPGFEPGEQVGIVQCAKEAGGDTPEARGGVDGCNLGNVVYADADPDGVASGSIVVSRVLTTPLTGTVDCAAEADRCLVAMGALSNYDRSGGHGISFVGGGEPIEIPTVSVTPADGLDDGDLVHVSASGLTPNTVVDLTVCSSDPAACWQTGEEIEIETGAPGDTGVIVDEDGNTVISGDGPVLYPGGSRLGLEVDGEGNAEGDVPVWRFLPGGTPGAYVDCAVSRCSLRLSGQTAPPTVPLGFDPGGQPPTPPAVSVDRTKGLEPGDTVIVQGAGFEPGSLFSVSLCGGPAGSPDLRYTCAATGNAEGFEERIDGDGTFAVEFELPELGQVERVEGGAPAPCLPGTACDDSGGQTTSVVDVQCDGVETECTLVVDVYQEGFTTGRPMWMPLPVPLTFR